MSIVAWDGKSLAADRMATADEMRYAVTKIMPVKGGAIAWCGPQEYGLTLLEWVLEGEQQDKWPECQARDNWARIIVVKHGGCIYEYESLPIPQPITEPFMAWGSGRDFAMGAMAAGATAKQAVEITNRFSTTCGCGVDVVRLTK